MNPEKILRSFALTLATCLLLVISIIWGAGALRLLLRIAEAPDLPGSA